MRKRNGFTLVELLVVIGIIALLVGILLPALSKARQQANKAACLSNLHSIGIAVMMYTATFKNVLPEGVGPAGNATWCALLSHNMGNKSDNSNTIGTIDNDKRLGIFLCKDAIQFTPQSQSHYSCHPLLMPDMSKTYPPGFPIPSPTTVVRKPYKITKVANSAEVALIWDSNQAMSPDTSKTPVGTFGNASDCAFEVDNNAISNTSGSAVYFLLTNRGIDYGKSVDGGPNVDAVKTFLVNTNDPQRTWANVRWRHSGNKVANFLFVDGHCNGLRYNSQMSTELLRKNLAVPLPN